jgi:hypothetical protein
MQIEIFVRKLIDSCINNTASIKPIKKNTQYVPRTNSGAYGSSRVAENLRQGVKDERF